MKNLRITVDGDTHEVGNMYNTDGQVKQFVVACRICMTMHEDGHKTGDGEGVGLTELLAEVA